MKIQTQNMLSRCSIIAITIALIVTFAGHCPAQTVEYRKTKPGPIVIWGQADYFKDAPKLKPRDWSSYPYTLDGKQFAIWGAFAVSGVLWGMREAYHADPYIFEKRWGVQSESFWGSDAWKRNYIDNNPNNPHKSEYMGNVGRDVWHTFGFGSKALIVGGSFAIGTRRQPLKYRVINLAIGWGIQSLFANITYQVLR